MTKWLARLEDEGLLARHRVRIPGRRVPVIAYHLSRLGWTEAEELHKRLWSDVVTVVTPRLGPLSVRLPEVPSLAPTRLDLTSAISLVNRGLLDLGETPPSGEERTHAPLVWRPGFRDADRLFGREVERRKLDAWYASDSRVLVLTGSPGIGKSALLADWIRGRRLDTAVYGFEFRPTTTLAGLLADLGSFLGELGRPSLAAYIARGDPVDLGVIQRLLRRELATRPVLTVLDNSDQVPRRTAQLLSTLLADLLTATPLKLVLAGRRAPSWSARLPAAAPVVRLRLQRLDPDASTALLRDRGIDAGPEVVEDIVRTSQGHPMRLHLAVSAGAESPSTEERRLVRDIWSGLAEQEQRVLEIASVVRKPVSERVLLAATRTDGPTVEDLVGRKLLGRTAAREYFAPDAVRSFVETRMDGPRTRALHERIAEPFLDGADPKERWEGVFHLLAAAKAPTVAMYLDAEGAPLLDSVAAEDIAAVLRTLPSDDLDAATSCVFSEILGDSLRIRGHVGPALRQYDHARTQAEASARLERMPRLLRKMAYIERCRNRYPEALGHLIEASARLTKLDDPVEKAEVLREMGIAEEAMGDSAAAVGHLGDAVDLATETSNPGALARGLLTLGTLETQHGHADRGLEYDREALRVAERSGALAEIAQAHIVLGADLAKAGRSEESLGECTLGQEIASRLGNLRLTAYATLNRASSLLTLRRYQEAGGPIKEAEGYFEILEEQDTLAFLKTYEGHRAMGLGQWARADRMWAAGLDGLRKHASPADFAHVLIEVAGFYLVRGERTKARGHLLEARGIARRLGSATILSEVEGILAPLNG